MEGKEFCTGKSCYKVSVFALGQGSPLLLGMTPPAAKLLQQTQII